MRFKSRVVKGSLVLGFLAGLALLSALWPEDAVERRSDSGMGILLTAPAFAQEAEMSFLEREAGISAYTKLSQKVDLTKVGEAFRTVEKEGGTYTVGSVPVPGYENDTKEDVRCFAHKDGWIVVYYPNSDPASRMMYWKNWDGKTISTKLEEALAAVSNAVMGIAPADIKYYHFRYPNANRLMIIADKRSFKLTIPSEFAVHERSYDGSIGIDNQSLGTGPGWIPLAQLKPDISHWISGGNKVIVLIYQEN